uniref:Uncharacterized protein n=1 Tax=Fusarium oxysporum (strain Fo5176) TaxID=660025 RepID=A0A0D2YFJ1_FUSOF
MSDAGTVSLTFRRKTTMAKHQRRSHQGGPESNEILVDCTSESDIGDSPLTPSQMDWPIQEVITPSTLAHGYPMHLASSSVIQDGNYSHPIPTTPACSLQDTSSVKSQSNANSCSQQLQQAKGLQPENGWCFRYQPLVTGVTIGQIPAFTSGVCDMYSGPKVGFNDPTMQLPSSRVETY